MRCNFESLCRYLNNELDGKRKQAVAAHLRECEICLEAVCLMLQDRGVAARIPAAQHEPAA